MALPFDTHQRLHLLKQFLTRLAPEKGKAHGNMILDVGGFPGILAREMEGLAEDTGVEVITIDRPAGAIRNYLQANALQLPFGDGAFHAVVCSDVLEHIGPSDRRQFIGEMGRVSRGWLLISGPFASSAVEQAEASVDELTKAVMGKSNAWLAEHRGNGLPKLSETIGLLSDLGFSIVIVPNGSLFTWFLLKQTELLYEAIPDAFPLFQSLNDLYVRFRADRDHALPTYRHLILAHRDVREVKGLIRNRPESFALPMYQREEEIPVGSDEGAAEEIRLYAQEFLRLIEKVKGMVGDGPMQMGASIDGAYLRRLESIVHEQEAQRTRLEGEVERLREENRKRGKGWWWRIVG